MVVVCGDYLGVLNLINHKCLCKRETEFIVLKTKSKSTKQGRGRLSIHKRGTGNVTVETMIVVMWSQAKTEQLLALEDARK